MTSQECDTARLCVAKVGGSLLELPDVAERLRRWLERAPRGVVLVAGGGEWVEAVRRADERFQLGEEAAHWLAADAMRTTALLLHALLPDSGFADEWPLEHTTLHAQGTTIIDAWQFLRADAAGAFGAPLPHSWQVTSDSIAARLARALGAMELVLLKSCDAPADASPATLAECGLVDEYFPLAATRLNVRWVNLRAGVD